MEMSPLINGADILQSTNVRNGKELDMGGGGWEEKSLLRKLLRITRNLVSHTKLV